MNNIENINYSNTLYISDLDGTLLNSRSQLSEKTISKLNFLIQQHKILFSIATARTPATVSDIMKEVHTKLPYIVMAGAALWNNNLMQYSQVKSINLHVITELLDIFEKYPIHPFIYRRHRNQIYAHHIPQMTDEEKAFIGHRLTSPLKQLVTEPTLIANDSDEAMLIYSMGKYEDLRHIADEIEEKGVFCTLMCYHDIFDQNQGYLEIYSQGTTKASAIQRLALMTGAKRVVVFGDNLNDIPMMESADYSIAVGNAFEEVKAKANETIGINDDDSVVQWIEHDLKTHCYEQ